MRCSRGRARMATLRLGFLPMLGTMARPWLRRFIGSHPGVELQTRHLTRSSASSSCGAGGSTRS